VRLKPRILAMSLLGPQRSDGQKDAALHGQLRLRVRCQAACCHALRRADAMLLLLRCSVSRGGVTVSAPAWTQQPQAVEGMHEHRGLAAQRHGARRRSLVAAALQPKVHAARRIFPASQPERRQRAPLRQDANRQRTQKLSGAEIAVSSAQHQD
jgi:hypothetical protein